MDLIRRELPDCLGHQIRFRVSGRIAIRCDRVLRRQDNLAVDDENCSKWVVARQSRLAGQFDGLPDEVFLNVRFGGPMWMVSRIQ